MHRIALTRGARIAMFAAAGGLLWSCLLSAQEATPSATDDVRNPWTGPGQGTSVSTPDGAARDDNPSVEAQAPKPPNFVPLGPNWRRQVARRLVTKKVTFEFVDVPLEQVLQYFRAQIGVNLVVAPDVNQQELVTLEVRDMTLFYALKWVLNLHGLHCTLKDEALYIYGTPPRERMHVRVYQMSDVVHEPINYRVEHVGDSDAALIQD